MADARSYRTALEHHYRAFFGAFEAEHTWNRGPGLPHPFCVLEFRPSEALSCWVYATCGMSPGMTEQLELFVLSPIQAPHAELLTIVAHYHRTGATLGHGHTVNIGRPWLPGSRCSFGLISLPYLFGPSLEWTEIAGQRVRTLWFLPITQEERDYKSKHGLEALEQRLEASGFNYLDPARPPVI